MKSEGITSGCASILMLHNGPVWGFLYEISMPARLFRLNVRAEHALSRARYSEVGVATRPWHQRTDSDELRLPSSAPTCSGIQPALPPAPFSRSMPQLL